MRNKYTIKSTEPTVVKYLANGRVPYGHPNYDGSVSEIDYNRKRRFARFLKKTLKKQFPSRYPKTNYFYKGTEPNPNWSMYQLSSAPHVTEVTEPFEP